jgi:hypothetical protein
MLINFQIYIHCVQEPPVSYNFICVFLGAFIIIVLCVLCDSYYMFVCGETIIKYWIWKWLKFETYIQLKSRTLTISNLYCSLPIYLNRYIVRCTFVLFYICFKGYNVKIWRKRSTNRRKFKHIPFVTTL